VANLVDLRAILVARFQSLDAHEICSALLAEGVPAGVLNGVGEALAEPHSLHRQMVVQAGDYRGTGIPIKLSDSPGSVRLAPPRFGEHSREILVSLGLSPTEIDRLIAAGIVKETR
jgi:crotonobetainyl-CoA:carnitine CoA-transferase CaiB-like acyl-CoA transferase